MSFPAAVRAHVDSDSKRRMLLGAGAAAIACAPLRLGAQQRKLPRIGFLGAGRPKSPLLDAFEDGLRERDLSPGTNVVVDVRVSEGRLERLPALAAELVAARVDVIVVAGPTPLRAALDAARGTPIVMIAASSDPVGEGLVKSLARPGGNLTGTTYTTSPERFGKQLELLKQAAPGTTRVGVFWDLELAIFERSWRKPLAVAARRLGLDVLPPTQVLEASAVAGAMEEMRRDGANGVLVTIAGPSGRYQDLIAAEAIRQRLATIAAFKEFTRAGGLVSYGPDFPALFRRGAYFVDRVLKGARPGDLPIELPTKYELALNRATAGVLGIKLTAELLLRADEVVG
jgi:putative ABC transport system substrate-binding protein